MFNVIVVSVVVLRYLYSLVQITVVQTENDVAVYLIKPLDTQCEGKFPVHK